METLKIGKFELTYGGGGTRTVLHELHYAVLKVETSMVFDEQY